MSGLTVTASGMTIRAVRADSGLVPFVRDAIRNGERVAPAFFSAAPLLGQHGNIGTLLNAQWFTQGLAVYISGMLDLDYAGAVQARLNPGFAPTTLADLWTDQANYPLSGSIVRYIARRFGRAALRNLLDARSTSTILTRLGIGEAELLTAWRADP